MTTGIKNRSNIHFYAMIALLKCAQFYVEAIKHARGAQYKVFYLLNRLDREINRFNNECTVGLSVEESTVWKMEWQRDFISLSVIAENWVNMDDEQRDKLEKFAIDLMKKPSPVETEPGK